MTTDVGAIIGPNSITYPPNNAGITPVFFVEAVLDHGATEKEGRTVYREKERVLIYIAGDPLSAVSHPIDEKIINRFREQYEAWKNTRSGAHISGMPLAKWPLATPILIKQLELLNIFSVEDLAAVADGNLHNIYDGRALRDKAIAWLESADSGAAAVKYASEAGRLRDEVADLKQLLEAKPRPSRAETQTEAKKKKRTLSAETREKLSARMKAVWVGKNRMHPGDVADNR